MNFPVVPVGSGEPEFQKSLDAEQLGDLRSNRPQMVDVIRSAQPFASAKGDWLPNLHTLWNEGKHRNLVYHSRIQNVITVDATSPEEARAVSFVDGLTFSMTGDRVATFLSTSHDEVLRVVDAAGHALYD